MYRQGLHGNAVADIVNRGEVERNTDGGGSGNAECPTLRGVNVELADEYARGDELHNLAGMSWIGIDGVALGSEQSSKRRKDQRQWPP
jgi:hypothetical protein